MAGKTLTAVGVFFIVKPNLKVDGLVLTKDQNNVYYQLIVKNSGGVYHIS